MTNLNSSTIRRLQQIKQSPTVWEGDRRPLPRTPEQDGTNLVHLSDRLHNDQPQCILWVDGSMGMVRAMDVVESGTGNEALVRALLQAIERPQSPGQPSRPQKILVRDRSLQFYLRGVLQGLDIIVEHVDHLPLVEEIFTNIIQHNQSVPPTVPAAYAPALYHQADALFRHAPWTYMWDHQVLGIELNQWDLDTVYAVIMGHLGLEQGVIFYRSRESLVRFREFIADQDAEDDLEETFLRQDCLFALFESAESLSESEIRTIRGYGYPITNEKSSYPIFGTLHPLEGGRPFLYDEEAIAMAVAMESLNLFISQHATKLELGEYDIIKSQYRIAPPSTGSESEIKVTVTTLPDLEEEIQAIVDEYDDEEDDDEPLIREDLWPDNTLIKLVGITWEGVNIWRNSTPRANCYLAPKTFPPKGDAFSVLLLQTSRPKGLELIKQIKELGNIKGVTFNPASLFGEPCALGLVVMGNDQIYLFGEFHDDNSEDLQMRQKWQQRCKNSKGYCAVVIAMGLTGASRGKPEPNHILAYYEVPLIPPKTLGLGTLMAEPDFDEDF